MSCHFWENTFFSYVIIILRIKKNVLTLQSLKGPSACLRACVRACVCVFEGFACLCVCVGVLVCSHNVKCLLSLVCLMCCLLCSITTKIFFLEKNLLGTFVCIQGFFFEFYLQTALNINLTS